MTQLIRAFDMDKRTSLAQRWVTLRAAALHLSSQPATRRARAECASYRRTSLVPAVRRPASNSLSAGAQPQLPATASPPPHQQNSGAPQPSSLRESAAPNSRRRCLLWRLLPPDATRAHSPFPEFPHSGQGLTGG